MGVLTTHINITAEVFLKIKNIYFSCLTEDQKHYCVKWIVDVYGRAIFATNELKSRYEFFLRKILSEQDADYWEDGSLH